jgi:hypothetical protein
VSHPQAPWIGKSESWPCPVVRRASDHGFHDPGPGGLSGDLHPLQLTTQIDGRTSSPTGVSVRRSGAARRTGGVCADDRSSGIRPRPHRSRLRDACAGGPGIRRRHERVQQHREKNDFTFTIVPRATMWIPFARRVLLTTAAGADVVYFQKYRSERSINPRSVAEIPARPKAEALLSSSPKRPFAPHQSIRSHG